MEHPRLDKTFRAKLQKSEGKGGWIFVKMRGSAQYFGTRGLVKVEGTVDEVPFRRLVYGFGRWNP